MMRLCQTAICCPNQVTFRGNMHASREERGETGGRGGEGGGVDACDGGQIR